MEKGTNKNDSDESVECDHCKVKNNKSNAQNYCTVCTESLCDDCTSVHRASNAYEKHLIVTLENKNDFEAQHDSSDSFKKCEPCEGSGKDTLAVSFCEECEELLCEQCKSLHSISKATKTHSPIDIKDIKEVKEDVTQKCEPCLNRGSEKKATNVCEVCEEFLCEDCTISHSLQKATKSHTPINVKDLKPKFERHCDICKISKIVTVSVLYCNECEEALCETCSKMHMAQKATKTHKLSDIKTNNLNENVCEPCKQMKNLVVAIKYCAECEEKLCQSCTQKHMAQKATKLHTLSDINTQSDTVKQIECYNCKLENKSESADMYCNNCEEFYCNHCSKLHKSQKATRSHELIDSRTVEAKDCRFCDDCLLDNLKNKTVCFCMECKVFYCENCRLSHIKVKTTREHKLMSAKEIEDEYSNDCGQCNHSSKQSVKATSFCQSCDEFLCKRCSDEHKDKRITRSHSLITSIEGSIIKLSEPQLHCKPCKEDDVTIRAISFCQQCKELLCKECVKQHKRHKPTRSHQLNSDAETIRELLNSRHQNDGEPVDNSTRQSHQIQAESGHGKETTLVESETIPGKPYAKDIKAYTLSLFWERPNTFESTDTFQIRYKVIDEKNSKWQFYGTESDVASAQLADLKANTSFIFQVRVIHQDGREGPYSEESDAYKTEQSPAAKLIKYANIVEKGKPLPNKHALPLTEIRKGRNNPAKTRKFELEGLSDQTCFEKTIMLVGATGTGKSTLVDGLVNYILGVKWDDPFRFTIIDLEDEEKYHLDNQALSQTEWITCYSINPQPGSRLEYRLNIIDTPGFGDTRGIERDQQITEQIRHLFSETGEKGIANIDYVCFLVKAPDARLTTTQTYIFESIMSLFGQDIENNITTLVTFADGLEPPVLAALKQSDLPFGNSFMFNNSGLFSKNVEIGSSSLSPMFWKMGCLSFDDFFAHLNKMEVKSLKQSKQVLEERRRLETTIENLLPEINAGLSKQNELKSECRIFKQHKSDIALNRNFEYEVEETHQEKIELPMGQHTTNCTHCHVTCHKSCIYANDNEKQNCSAMNSEGHCNQCKCHWTLHSNTRYIFEYVQVKKKLKYADKQKKYKKLLGETPTHEKIIKQMTVELTELDEGIEKLMTVHMNCHDRLKQIALRPNPLNLVEHIDLMIKAEEMENKSGSTGRINMLKEHRQKAQVTVRVQTFRDGKRATMKEVPTITTESKDGIVGKFLNFFHK